MAPSGCAVDATELFRPGQSPLELIDQFPKRGSTRNTDLSQLNQVQSALPCFVFADNGLGATDGLRKVYLPHASPLAGISQKFLQDCCLRQVGCRGSRTRWLPVGNVDTKTATISFGGHCRVLTSFTAYGGDELQNRWQFRFGSDRFLTVTFESDPLVFIDDDEGYLKWISGHPYGFVLNAGRSPTAAYVMLHRTSCGHIQGRPSNGVSWTTDLLKACSESRVEIERWVRTMTGGTPSPCGHCHP